MQFGVIADTVVFCESVQLEDQAHDGHKPSSYSAMALILFCTVNAQHMAHFSSLLSDIPKYTIPACYIFYVPGLDHAWRWSNAGGFCPSETTDWNFSLHSDVHFKLQKCAFAVACMHTMLCYDTCSLRCASSACSAASL